MSLSSSDIFEVRFPTVDGDFVDAWIDVPRVMPITTGAYNVFPFRYRLGRPIAEGAFSMLFFDTPEDRLKLINALEASDVIRLPKTIFKPVQPIDAIDPELWYEGTVQIIASANNRSYYRSAYFGAAIIEQPSYEGSVSPLEIPAELNIL